MMEWMGELDTVGGQEVDLLSLRHQFTFHKVIVLLNRSLYRSKNEVNTGETNQINEFNLCPINHDPFRS